MDLDPDRLDVPMDATEAQTDDEMMDDPTHPIATTHSVDPDGDIEFDEEDEGGMEAEPTPPIGVIGVTGFNFEEPGRAQEIEEAIMEDMGGDEVERVANDGSFVVGVDGVSGEAGGLSVIAMTTVGDSALLTSTNEHLGTLEEDHGEDAEQTDHLDDAEHVDYAAHNEAHEGVEHIEGTDYSEGDHTGHEEGVEPEALAGEGEHEGEGDYEIAEEGEGGDHDAETWDEREEYDEADPDEIHDEHDEDYNHDDEDCEHEGDITADVDETEDGQGGVTKGTAVPASAAVDLEEHAEGEGNAEDPIPHPAVEAAGQTPLPEELSHEAGSLPEDADEVYFDIEEDEYDEEDLDMEYPHDLHSLPPIILHLPTSLEAGDARILFATSPEVSDTPILLDGRLEGLGEASLSDVWKAIRTELGGEKLEQKGEMIITERQMELKMGESVTLLELAQVYCGCGLPSPMELYVTYEPHRFITRFNAIQQEVQAQLREMSEDADEEAESAVVVGVNVEHGGDAYHEHENEAEAEAEDEAEDAAEAEAEDAAEAEAEDEAEKEEAAHGEAEGDEDDNVERETRTEEQSRPKRALQGDTNAEHGSKRGRPAPEESAHPHADWANSKPVQTLGTTTILPRKLREAEDSTTSPDSAEIFDVLPPPNRREMPEGEGKDDDDDDVHGEDEERNVDIEQSGEDQLEMSGTIVKHTYYEDSIGTPHTLAVEEMPINDGGEVEGSNEDDVPNKNALATAVEGNPPLDEVALKEKENADEDAGVLPLSTPMLSTHADFDLEDTTPEPARELFIDMATDNDMGTVDADLPVVLPVVYDDVTEDSETETAIPDNATVMFAAAEKVEAAADEVEKAKASDIDAKERDLRAAEAELRQAEEEAAETEAAAHDEDLDTVADDDDVYGLDSITDRAMNLSGVPGSAVVSPAATLDEEGAQTSLDITTDDLDGTGTRLAISAESTVGEPTVTAFSVDDTDGLGASDTPVDDTTVGSLHNGDSDTLSSSKRSFFADDDDTVVSTLSKRSKAEIQGESIACEKVHVLISDLPTSP